jgi:C1A family cysteine protease
MNKVLFVASLLFVATLAVTVDETELKGLWSAWKSIHNKPYGSGEDEARYAIFRENHKKILKFNAENSGVKLGLNKFADLTSTEFKQKHASCRHQTDNEVIAKNTMPFDRNAVKDLPDKVDWRAKGAVTQVKDQGQCGSCWAFSATGVLEGYYYLKYGKLLSFSEQQIVSCDLGQNEGCNGGYPELAVEYAAKSGLDLEKDYPYKAADAKCKFSAWTAVKINTGYQFVTANSTEALMTAIVASPVSVSIEADEDVFQLYTSGIIQSCGANIDHAVLAVGYTKDYFIVKNSWGTDWGNGGYVQIGTDNKPNKGQGVCGILSGPVIAI